MLDGGAQHDRDAPALARVGLAAQVAEAALRELESRALRLDGDERVARLEDPAVHDRRDGQARGVSEGLPEIGGLGVGEAVPLEVQAHALPEHGRAQVLLEHAERRGALLVREKIEHRHAIVRVPYFELDGPRRLEAVDRHRGRARHAESDPALPLRLPGVHGKQLHERGEGLVEPDAVPPGHGDEIAEPHVRHFVRDHVGDALELAVRGRGFVHEQRVLAEGDGAQVLHRARCEVGDGEEIDLVARVRQAVVAFEELERERSDREREPREVLLARHAPDPEWRPTDHDRVRRLQLADHEGHEVGRHPDAVGEGDGLAPVAQRFFPDHRAIGDRGEVVRDDQGDAEDRLEGGLVPARESPPRIRGLELRGSDGVRLAGLILVCAAVEAVEPIVEDAREADRQPPFPRRDRRRKDEPGALGRFVERDRPVNGHAALARDGHALDRELGSVEDNLGKGRLHLDRDDGLSGEGGGRQVGLEPQVVPLRHDRRRQPVVHGGR